MKTFFLVGGYTYKNPGDEALLRADLISLEKKFPGSRYLVWREDDSMVFEFEDKYDVDYLTFKPLPWLRHGNFGSGKLRSLYRVLFPASPSLAYSISMASKKIIQRLGSCDLAVFVGGGYLNSLYNLAEMQYLQFLCKKADLPLVLLGQTIGPFYYGKDRSMAETICSYSKAVSVRERHTFEEIKNWNEAVYLGVDDALMFHEPVRHEELEGHLTLGLNLKRAEDSDRYYEKIRDEILKFARMSGLKKVRVVFIPMETGDVTDDREEYARMNAASSDMVSFEVISWPLSAEERYVLCASMDLMVAMRFHALVFALSSGVPSIGLYHGSYLLRKTQGLMESFEMPLYSLSLSRINELSSLLEELFQKRLEIRAHLLSLRGHLIKKQGLILDNVLGRAFSDQAGYLL